MQQNTSQREKRKAWILAAALTGLNLLLFVVPMLRNYTFETRAISVSLAIGSAVLYLAHIPLCIYLRLRKKTWIARGIFFYELAGALAYIVYFFGYITGQAGTPFISVCYSLFRWWTLWYEPIMVTLSRLIGIPLKFTMGIIYLVLIEFSGSTVTAIKKDIRYEWEREEDRAYEESTRGHGGQW